MVVVTGLTLADPAVAVELLHQSEVHEVALLVDQDTLDEPPEVIDVGLAVTVTEGTPLGHDPAVEDIVTGALTVDPPALEHVI